MRPPTHALAHVFGAFCGGPNCASAGTAEMTSAAAESKTAAFMGTATTCAARKNRGSGAELRERPDCAGREGSRPARQRALFDIEIGVMMFPRVLQRRAEPEEAAGRLALEEREVLGAHHGVRVCHGGLAERVRECRGR